MPLVTKGMPGHHLRRLRKKAKLSQSQLAAQLGVHWNTVARWERGEVAISTSHCRLIEMVLEPVPDMWKVVELRKKMRRR